MRSFLLNKDNKPILSWGLLPDETYFEGEIPQNYFLAVCPSENIVILDIDNKNNKNGIDNIPEKLKSELFSTFCYNTKSGMHVWINYTGNKILLNKSTKLGLDLRIGHNKETGNCGGYVKWYLEKDIRYYKHLIKDSSKNLNKWLEKLFSNN